MKVITISRSLLLIVVISVSANLSWGAAGDKPAGDSDAATKLNELKSKLPKLTEDWAKRSFDGPWPADWTKVQVARRTSPTTAKITVLLSTNRDNESLVTMHLSYFEGAWTVVRHEAELRGFFAGREKYLLALMLAIDQE